jgi:hypothetical protein
MAFDTKLSRNGIYCTCDWPTSNEITALGFKGDIGVIRRQAHNIGAVWTGEKRCPKKGEWYLSGAEVGAYRAPNDLTTEYHIAKLVAVEHKTVTVRV